MKVIPRKVVIYQTVEGKAPFEEWLGHLRDWQAVSKIQARIARLRVGNLGNWRHLGKGILELKVDFGPGYRVYFAESGGTLVVLLCGGDKRTQGKDIEMARRYWEDFRRRYETV